MKTVLMVAMLVAAAAPAGAQQRLADQLRKGIVEEEANRNLDKAIQAYQSIVAQYDEDRKAAGTALFRLAECYRKAGKREQAIAAYQRVAREFADQGAIAEPSRQNLASLGVPESVERATTAREEAVQAAQAKVKKAEEHLDQLSKTYGPNHPEVVKARSALEAAQADLKAQTKRAPVTGTREPERVREVAPEGRAFAEMPTDSPEETRIAIKAMEVRMADVRKKIEIGVATPTDLQTLHLQLEALRQRYEQQMAERQASEQQAQETRALTARMVKSVEAEIVLVQEQIAAIEKKVSAGTVSAQDTELLQLRRDLLGLQRKLDEMRASLKR